MTKIYFLDKLSLNGWMDAISHNEGDLVDHKGHIKVIKYSEYEQLKKDLTASSTVIDILKKENEKLKEQNTILIEALKYYGAFSNWQTISKDQDCLLGDCIHEVIGKDEQGVVVSYVAGKRAREALKKVRVDG